MINLTSLNFEEEVEQSDSLIVIDLYADWCAPCRMLAPILEELEREIPSAKFCKINIDSEPALAQMFRVESIPMIAHSVGEWSVILAPTCHSDGTRTRECSECDYFETETLSALTHEFGDWSAAEAPTCGQAGVEKRTCSLCGDIEEQQIEQLTHEYGEWIVISGSKLIPPIVREKTCELCGNTETVKDWSNVWITILVGIALIGVTIGIINYIVSIKKAQKRK